MLFMTGVYDRVLTRLDSLDMSESDLARAVGEFPQTLHNWKRRGAVPGFLWPVIQQII